MTDETSSVVSDIKFSLGINHHDHDTSDSFNSNNLRPCKRARYHESNVNVNVTRFKGVVPQQNGHWGAQVYANHQRIWLGTFKSEKEAAMAYDSTLIKLRNKDFHRNFPWNDRSIQEPSFQNHYTKEAVLNMIKDGSYEVKFEDYLRTLSQDVVEGPCLNNSTMVHDNVEFSCMQLFQKELTPSDVGKLNRLVIPKKYAVKYFPNICENNLNGGVDDCELVFYDKSMKVWTFRYCYWKSSQSFVFTRGWNRFVKEKKLKEKDLITFHRCRNIDGQQNFLLIDCGQSCGQEVETHLELKLEQSNFGSNNNGGIHQNGNEREGLPNEVKMFMVESSTHNVEGKGFRLFGVKINA